MTLVSTRYGLVPRAMLLSAALLFSTASQTAHSADFKDAKALMRHIDRLWRSDSSRAIMSMTVQTSHYKRTMQMETWSKGKDRSLVIIRKPKKDRGIATLKVKENIWNYLPKINRVTKVPASMMSGSWMGSHFTNDDLIKENTFEDDYVSKISFSGEKGGLEIYEVTSTPRLDAPVVWGKVVMQIEKSKLTPLVAFYYDEEGALARTMRFEDVQKKASRYVPMRLVLTPEDKPDESTIIVYHDIKFDMNLSDRIFSLQNLQKRQ